MDIAQIFQFLGQDFWSNLVPYVANTVVAFSPILLVYILFKLAWELWVDYVRSKNFLKLKYTILELRLPKETFKSPAAMETVLHALHNTADGTRYAQYWKGETRPWYSLEIASFEGDVRFMIWTEDRRKSGVMGALYSQFPGIEIYEREDYAKSVQFDPKTMRIWAAEFKLTQPDPYPIKTYVDYGLEKDPKEEYKVDPLTHYLEFLGNVKANQQNWVQILIRAHKDDQKKPGLWFGTYDEVKDKAQKLINEKMIRNKDKVSGTVNDKGFLVAPTLSKREQETVTAIERKVSKLMFDVCIRVMYISPKDTFDTPFGIGGNISSLKQFNSEDWNGFRPNGKKWHGQFDGYPWEDYKNMRRSLQARMALAAYRRRSIFYTPFAGEFFVLNTEELATIYHFPGSVSATPSLGRVPSKKSSAPSNLPI